MLTKEKLRSQANDKVDADKIIDEINGLEDGTKHFSVFMDSIDAVGKIKYNLKARKISFTKGHGEVIWK